MVFCLFVCCCEEAERRAARRRFRRVARQWRKDWRRTRCQFCLLYLSRCGVDKVNSGRRDTLCCSLSRCCSHVVL